MRNFRTPQKWKRYEKEAVRVAQDWIERAQYEGDEWLYHIHLFAANVYNRGDGLVFLYFNERTQRGGMTDEFKDWMSRILDGVSRLPFS